MSTYAGISYGVDAQNIDPATGVAYGRVPVSSLLRWADDAHPIPAQPQCPYCGLPVREYPAREVTHFWDHVYGPVSTRPDWALPDPQAYSYACLPCERVIPDEDVHGTQPARHVLDDPECLAVHEAGDAEVWILRSLYYTVEEGRPTYCPPPAWFAPNQSK